MKKYLIVYYGDAPECVEGFKKECKRSCKGALHLNPGQKKTVTEDEYKHIQSHYKHCLPKLRVISEMDDSKKKEDKGEAKEEKAEPKAKPNKAQTGKKETSKKTKKARRR